MTVKGSLGWLLAYLASVLAGCLVFTVTVVEQAYDAFPPPGAIAEGPSFWQLRLVLYWLVVIYPIVLLLALVPCAIIALLVRRLHIRTVFFYLIVGSVFGRVIAFAWPEGRAEAASWSSGAMAGLVFWLTLARSTRQSDGPAVP